MKRISFFAAALIATFALGAAALAVVNFDPATGLGFAGKGDVQKALSLNNAQLQSLVNSNGIVFTYEDEIQLSQLCERDAGQSETRTRTMKRERKIDSVVEYEARRNSGINNQVTGFRLIGYSEGGSGGFVMPTDICPDPNPNPGEPVWSPAGPVEIVSQSGGVLKVNGVPLG